MLSFDTIIIGGGVSGIAAAGVLEKAGLSNFLILEAQDVAGGRIKTHIHNNHVLELGAQWIHGSEESPLFDYAVQNDLIDTRIRTEGEGLFVTEEGEEISPKIVQEIKVIISEAENEELDHAASVGAFLWDYFLDKTRDSPRHFTMKEAMFRWMMKFEAVDNACNSMNDLSAKHWSDFVDLGGEKYVTVNRGYINIVNQLLREIPEDRIMYNNAVQNIYWSREYFPSHLNVEDWDESNIVIKTECGKYYSCDHVIVTCSLGFLKENHAHLFKPLLPHVYKQAIGSIGFGTIDKIYLEYPTKFWDDEHLGIHLVWKNEDESVLTPDEIVDDMSDLWYKSVTGFDTVLDHPNILMGWIFGDAAHYMESLPEYYVADVLTRVLRLFLNDPSVPFPSRIIRTQWYTNKYIRGSYSNRKLQMAPEAVEHLQQPICDPVSGLPLILFAGEACSVDQYSTVNGALLSGRMQAECLVQSISKLENSS